MTTKTIKDVNEDTWRKLKMFSAEEDVNMGRLIERMAENYAKNRNDVWKKILEGRKILSDEEAKEIESTVKKLRKESGFRDESCY